jgi:hypothetical protein
MLALGLLLGASEAMAHIRLLSPLARHGDSQKSAPCGITGGERSANPYVYAPGETLSLEIDEFIDHPSHYRVAFDTDGHDDFIDPSSLDEFYSNDAVLMDNLPDGSGGTFTIDVQLPDVECENCTLQLVQVMYDKAPPLCPSCIYGDNDLYYLCVDIALRSASGGEDEQEDTSSDETGDDTSTGGGDTGDSDDETGLPTEDSTVQPSDDDGPPETDESSSSQSNLSADSSLDASAENIDFEGGCNTAPGAGSLVALACLLALVRRRAFHTS